MRPMRLLGEDYTRTATDAQERNPYRSYGLAGAGPYRKIRFDKSCRNAEKHAVYVNLHVNLPST